MIEQALRRVDIPSRYYPVDESLAEHAHQRDEEGDSIRTGWLLDTWKQAREDAEQSSRGFVLALDEIQYVKGWSTIVKGQWDRDRRTGCPLRVIVSGSAPWSLLTGLHESLAGRLMPVQARHWSFSEMSAAFDFGVDEYLFFGGYPGMASEVGDVEAWRKAVLKAIIAPAIERDIIALTRVDKPPLMRRLMELAARYSGQMLSYNKMLGQLREAGNTSTLATYLDLLSDAGIVTGLPRYSNKPYPGRASSPKLNVLNTALMTAPLTYTFEEARADRTFWGRLVESAVGAHLHNTGGSAVELSQLEGRSARGRFRALPRSKSGRHRSQERTTTGQPQRALGVPEAVSGRADARGGGAWGAAGGVSLPPGALLGRQPDALRGWRNGRKPRRPRTVTRVRGTLTVVPRICRPDVARAGAGRRPDPARRTNQVHGGRPRTRAHAVAGPGVADGCGT